MARTVLMATVVSWLMGCVQRTPSSVQSPKWAIPANAEQLIAVNSVKGEVFRVRVTAMDWRGDRWDDVLTARPGVIGPNGFATLGEKREGDGRTPTGVYRIGTAF